MQSFASVDGEELGSSNVEWNFGACYKSRRLCEEATDATEVPMRLDREADLTGQNMERALDCGGRRSVNVPPSRAHSAMAAGRSLE